MADRIDPRVSIGHVHLKVADLDRALAFLLRRAGVRGDGPDGSLGGLSQRRRLSPSHRPEHLGEPQRTAAAAECDRPLSRGDPLSRSGGARRRAAAPGRRAMCRSTARRITASAKRSTCAIPTATASSCIGIARAISGLVPPDGSLQMTTERLDVDALLAEAAATASRRPPAATAAAAVGRDARRGSSSCARGCSRCTSRCSTMRTRRTRWIAGASVRRATCCSW